MDTTLLVVLIAAVVIAAIGVWMYLRTHRTKTLRSRFGPEYERAVHQYGDRTHAERELETRAKRADQYHIRSLNQDEQHQFSDQWHGTQARFVDDPPLAIREADHLVCEVMRARGYPMTDFDRRAEDLSASHPAVVRNYRAAHEIATQQEQGRATTEDLRKAMVYYRDLFDELLEAQPAGSLGRR